MDATANGATPTSTSSTVELTGSELGTITLERLSGRKASRAFALIRAISGHIPDLVDKWGDFRTQYRERHAIELDRAQAQVRYGSRPLIGEDDRPVLYPDVVELPDGETKPHPKAGTVVMVPGPLDDMTEDAWAAIGHKVRLPQDPSTGEQIAAIFADALEVAEDHVYRLLALFTMSNAEVKDAMRADWTEALEARVELVIDADFDALLELAVAGGELVDKQMRSKLEELGERTGKALRLLGFTTGASSKDSATSSSPATSTDTPESSTPTSSTDGRDSTDGTPTPSSTRQSTSSPDLSDEPVETASG